MDNPNLKFGFWSALIAFVATLSFDIAQMLQLLGFFSFPVDEILIYGFSLCIGIPLLLAMLALHYTIPLHKKIWSHAGVLFTLMYVIFVTANYVVQLATVIPAGMKGEGDKVSVLIQSPHSMFWNFDAIGYIFMGLATGFAFLIFPKTGSEKWVRYAFISHALVTPLIAVVYFYPEFSDTVLLLGIPWAVTAPLFMLLLSLRFYRRWKHPGNSVTVARGG